MLLSIIAIVIFTMNNFYVWSWGDDYLIKNRLHKSNVLAFLLHDYMTFDGRSLNAGYFMSRACLASDFAWLASSISGLLFLASAYMLVYLSGSGRSSYKLRFVYTVLYTCMLWLASFYFLNETLYWQTGSLYVVEVFLLLLAYTVWTASKKLQVSVGLQCLVYGIASVASPGPVLALAFVMLFESWYDKSSGKQLSFIQKYYFILPMCAGLLLVLLAPGSKIRFLLEGGVDVEAFSNVHNLYFRIHQFVSAFFAVNTPIVWMVILMGVVFNAQIIKTDINKQQMRIIDIAYHFVFEFRWLIAACITLLFYFPRMKYYIVSPRLNIHFVFFAFVFFAVQYKTWQNLKALAYIPNGVLSISFVMLVFIGFAFSQLWGSMHALKKVQARESLYRANRGRSLILKANDIIGPPTTRMFIDVYDDSTEVINKDISKYFGLKSLSKRPYKAR